MSMRKISLLAALYCIISSLAWGQLKIFEPKNIPDTLYIKSYRTQFNVRAFTVNRFQNFTVSGNGLNNGEHIRFSSNKPMGIGIGAVYKIYNINVSVGLPRIRPFDPSLGKTRSIDLHSTMYGRKWVFDLYGQFYKGFNTQNLSTPLRNGKYPRTDIVMNTVGVTANYIFNNNRFSYRAFRINDEWQHKSSGSFIVSLSSFIGQIHSDQFLGLVSKDFYYSEPNRDVRKKMYMQLGPGGGYAYNFVFRKKYFLLTSFNTRVMYDWGKEFTVDNSIHPTRSWNWGYTALAAAGFQNEHWGANLSVINTFNKLGTEIYDGRYRTNIGYVKLTVLYRIPHSRLTRQLTRPFDYLLRK